MVPSHVVPLLRELTTRTLNGALRWRRSTEDQVYADTAAGSRVVLTRRDQRTLAFMALRMAEPKPIGSMRLTIHTLSEGKTSEASVTIDSARLPHHGDALQTLWRNAQEAADAPVGEVVAFLRGIGADAAAEEALKNRPPRRHVLEAAPPENVGTSNEE